MLGFRVYGILGCNSVYELMIPTIGSGGMDGLGITVSACQSQCHLPLRGCANDTSVREFSRPAHSVSSKPQFHSFQTSLRTCSFSRASAIIRASTLTEQKEQVLLMWRCRG